MYLALDQHGEAFFLRGMGSISLNVRATHGSPAPLTKSVVAAIAGVSPRLTVTVHPLTKQIGDSLARERVIAMLAGFFRAFALLVAGAGLYRVTADAVNRRRIQIRIS